MILVTAFTPWGSLTENPTRTVADALHGTSIRDRRIETAVLPVSFRRAPLELEALIARHRPEIVLSLGLAGRRSRLSLERVGRNHAAPGTDLDGAWPGGPLAPGAPDVLPVPLAVEELVDGLEAHGFPAEVSDDAGGYVCNAVLYHALLWRHRVAADTLIGFLHIPWLLESSPADRASNSGDTGRPMPKAQVVAGVRWLLERL
jgi:pyroglutamyl-peptidase